MELRRFRADLHIHSCLSPCGELTNFPRKIVERALDEGLHIIALSDHNTAENAAATVQAAAGTGLTVLPGMELTSEEEVHILAVFESMADALPAQEEIYKKLPVAQDKAPYVQDQVVVNKDDEVMGFCSRCLMAATRLTVREVVELIHRHNGLAIASHIDREAFGLVSQLGFIPPDLALDALEVSPLTSIAQARAGADPASRLPMVRFSDAHRPEEIGRASTEFLLAAPTVGELSLALHKKGGRKVFRP